jgi:hypothetical protein
MNYLKKYVNNNTNLVNIVFNKIFKKKSMKLDHISHRTFKNDLVSHNYIKKHDNFKLMNDRFRFTNHHIYAEWWDNTKNKNLYNDTMDKRFYGEPKLFIFTYKGVKNDPNLINSNIDIDKIDFHIKNPDSIISYKLYREIWEKNQYLAWTLVHRNEVDHVAIEVTDINVAFEKVNAILPINNPETPIQISKDENLLQFSTKSTLKSVLFEEGPFNIPHNFIEFIERKNNRNGFSMKNADIIFNSTK